MLKRYYLLVYNYIEVYIRKQQIALAHNRYKSKNNTVECIKIHSEIVPVRQ